MNASVPQSGEFVLVIWSGEGVSASLESLVQKTRAAVGNDKNVVIENMSRFSEGGYAAASFDLVLTCLAPSTLSPYSDTLLSRVLTVLRPGGRFSVSHAPESIIRSLTLAGFVRCSGGDAGSDNTVLAYKPQYEVGSSVALKLGSSGQNVPGTDTRVWTLGSTVDDDLMGDDELLSSEDLIKPDPQSLRVCGTTGRRKACKDCSCGLAEELAAESSGANTTSTSNNAAKSSCGSCYLGDAFRCASCPYLGMPAFKPGEKVQLSTSQLTADS